MSFTLSIPEIAYFSFVGGALTIVIAALVIYWVIR